MTRLKKLFSLSLIFAFLGAQHVVLANEDQRAEAERLITQQIEELKATRPEVYDNAVKTAEGIRAHYQGLSREALKNSVTTLAVSIYDPENNFDELSQEDQELLLVQYVAAKHFASQHDGLKQEIYKSLFAQGGVLYEKGITPEDEFDAGSFIVICMASFVVGYVFMKIIRGDF